MNSAESFVLSNYLAALAKESCFTPEEHAMREDALRSLPEMLLSCDATGVSPEALAYSYFMCTYGETSHKHDIKRSINSLVRSALVDHGIFDAEPPAAMRAEKPRCVVVTNHFRSNHVMFRAFAKSLHALREHLHTVNLCLAATDDAAAIAFDETRVLRFAPEHWSDSIKKLRDYIVALAPEVIVYADIAMHPFGMFASNLRLAPLQVVLSGHPAPSQSPQIDAFIADDSFRGFTPDYDERVRLCPRDEFAIYASAAGKHPSVPTPRSTRGVKIVVPATLQKITYPLLAALNEIGKRCPSAEIHLTTNAENDAQEISERIKRVAPNLVTYGAMQYNDFLTLIASSDMFLAPFPFSGFNSIQDCLALGIPGVALKGADIAEHQAANMIERTGAHSLVADTPKGYAALGAHLADALYTRVSFREALLEKFREPEKMSIFAPTSPGIAREVWKLYRERVEG